MNKYIKLQEELSIRNQFKKSQLTDDIFQVFGCTLTEALEYQKTHCNVLSLWAIMYAQQYTEMSYADFLKFCLENKYLGREGSVPAKGYLNATKKAIFEKLGIDAQVIQYATFPNDRKPGECYQVSINGNHHFIAAIVNENKSVDIFDTNDRGCPVEIGQGFSKRHDKLDWVKFIG